MAYTSQYPTQDTDHVKATVTNNEYDWQPYYATNPLKSVTASWISSNCWEINSDRGQNLPIRFSIDLGASFIIRQMKYVNGHAGDASYWAINSGLNAVVIQGSNSADAFADLDPTHDTDWTQIWSGNLVKHAEEEPDYKYLDLTSNTVSYQYFSLKVASNFGSSVQTCIRRIELQTEDGYGESTIGPFPTFFVS